jgi:hypothetical protein
MSTPELIVEEICETLRTLPEEQLDEVLRFVQNLEITGESATSDEALAPLYGIHAMAVRTGIPDLAHQHDHYLYGTEKQDA